ncbi:MAG: ABC transporter permease [Acidobacteria bacterium]|nr:ABC transporter permease [Acidobacteriota bacterium]
MWENNFLAGLWPIFKKEVLQILRDPTTLFFALFVPIFEMVLLGVAVDTNVRQIKTVVYDLAKTQESQVLIERYISSDDFNVVAKVNSDRELYDKIVSGEAKVGIKIPEDYSRALQKNTSTSVLLIVDGSESNVTSEAVNVSSAITLQESLKRIATKSPGIVESRHKVLFNPNTRSANFFIPGLVAVVMQLMIIILISFSLVKERERGTLENLYLAPISPLGLMIGKMLPYGLLGFFELCWILLVMRYLFDVPIHGSVLLLLIFSIPFILTILGMGLIISTRARTQSEAMQLATSTLLPSIFLSGYIFSLDNMPQVFWIISRFIPTTYYIDTLRGIIIRGAEFKHLWMNGLALLVMGLTMLILAAFRFRQTNV